MFSDFYIKKNLSLTFFLINWTNLFTIFLRVQAKEKATLYTVSAAWKLYEAKEDQHIYSFDWIEYSPVRCHGYIVEYELLFKDL